MEHFKYLKERLRNPGQDTNFYGARFELNVAATLARHKISFEIPDATATSKDAPDFFIPDSSRGVTLECACTMRLKDEPKSSYFYKIKSTIHRKENKEYADSNAALFVDITNLFFQTMTHEISLFDLIDRPRLHRLVENYSFGNLTLVWYETLGEGIASIYRRFDSPSIAENLEAFLDAHFPFGRHEHDDGFSVPSVG
jgi:hypothetical protein